MEKAVQQGPVVKEELPEVPVNSKNEVPVGGIDKLKGHGSGTPHGIQVSAGRAETAVAAEGDEFQLPAAGAAVHGPARGGTATVHHLNDIFHLSFSGMEGIFNFLIMIPEDVL